MIYYLPYFNKKKSASLLPLLLLCYGASKQKGHELQKAQDLPKPWGQYSFGSLTRVFLNRTVKTAMDHSHEFCKTRELRSKMAMDHSSEHTGQCKRTGGCYNELVVAFLSTGGGVKGKKIYTC